jgi:hypothetical protein
MTSVKYIGMDVHKESISICVRNSVGKVVMESVIETKASTILQFIDGLRGDLRVTFEEGTWAAWLYDLLKPRVSGVEVCNPQGCGHASQHRGGTAARFLREFAGQGEEAHDGPPDLGPKDCRDHLDRLEEGGTFRRQLFETTSCLSASG